MAKYEKAPVAVVTMMNDLLFTYKDEGYQALIDAKVRIDLLMAFGNEDAEGTKRPSIKVHGVPANGVARIVSYKDRVKGMGDAEIILDADWWETASDAERKALLDHELHHIVLHLDDDGQVQFDDCRRPKLKLRKHDFEIGVFNVIAARHGDASGERKYMNYMLEGSGQIYWPSLFEKGNPKPRKQTGPAPRATA